MKSLLLVAIILNTFIVNAGTIINKKTGEKLSLTCVNDEMNCSDYNYEFTAKNGDKLSSRFDSFTIRRNFNLDKCDDGIAEPKYCNSLKGIFSASSGALSFSKDAAQELEEPTATGMAITTLVIFGSSALSIDIVKSPFAVPVQLIRKKIGEKNNLIYETLISRVSDKIIVISNRKFNKLHKSFKLLIK